MKQKFAIFVLATHYVGEPPDKMKIASLANFIKHQVAPTAVQVSYRFIDVVCIHGLVPFFSGKVGGKSLQQ